MDVSDEQRDAWKALLENDPLMVEWRELAVVLHDLRRELEPLLVNLDSTSTLCQRLTVERARYCVDQATVGIPMPDPDARQIAALRVARVYFDHVLSTLQSLDSDRDVVDHMVSSRG